MNLTTTNYLFPTKEGRFQRWRRLSFCPPPCGMGAAARCEGRCPSGASRQTWLLLPEVEGLHPHAPIGRALRPIPREFMRGWQPLHPPVGLPGPHPGFLSFHDERNQRRAGATAPGPREGGTLSPLRRRRKASRTPPMGVSDTTKDRFATLSERANRSFVLPQFLRGNTFGC